MPSFTLCSRFTVARWIFARTLGVIFFCAFASLGVQIRGLAGQRGIVPAGQFLDNAWNQLGRGALWQLPSIFWVNASDTMLVAVCVLGMAISLGMICGFMPGLCALLLWGLYLSLSWVAMPFTLFQWDCLLVETALPAAVLLSWRIRPRWKHWRPAQQAALWVLLVAALPADVRIRRGQALGGR